MIVEKTNFFKLALIGTNNKNFFINPHIIKY